MGIIIGIDNGGSGGGGLDTLSAELIKTGQTTSYYSGDAGDNEAGRGVSFLVLPGDNPFGNTARFTGTNGVAATTYAGNGVNFTVLDWTTWDGSTVLGINTNATLTGNVIWTAALDACNALNFDSHTDWRSINKKEMQWLANDGLTTPIAYLPFHNVSTNYWTSNTPLGSTTKAYYWYTTTDIINVTLKSGASGKARAVRNYTAAELGL